MKIGIVGLGLIGASLGRAILKYTEHEVFGLDIDRNVSKRADELNAQTKPLLKDDYKRLDLVLFALNPDIAVREMSRICPLLKDGAVVADTCGNKRVIIKEMEKLHAEYPHLHFVGTHPMAGREFSGIEYSDPDLFKNAYLILVPVSDDRYPVEIMSELGKGIGMKRTEICSARRHDEMIAYTSQLAHVVSSCYVQNPRSKEHTGYSAGSFSDLTRVARLNPDMWTELFLQNKDNLLDCIDDMSARLSEIRSALDTENADLLKKFLAYGTQCKEIADRLKETDSE